ncbi:MAG: T9SS type A sorting domain-containing protein [Taibaiella sp.]|jgi:hypothetical protein
MKKIHFLIALSFAFLLPQIKVNAQTSLVAGDISIVGYNTDSITNDEFSFILLTSVSASTEIFFTDFGWCSGGSFTGFQSANPGSCGANTGALSDGIIKWTASTALPCGTQIKIQCQTTLTASTGTVTGVQTQVSIAGTYMSLAVGGDEIFAYQGSTASPTLLTGLNMNGGWDAVVNQCDVNSATSTLPAALNATNSLAITPEVDNATYNGTVTSASPAQLRTAIFNASNWNVNDTSPFSLPLPFTFSCVACVAPSITGNPPNRTICLNGSTTFPATATGTGLTYQWQVNTGSGFTNITNGAPYSNATTATLTVTGATAGMSGYTYRCVVTGTCGSANSNSATLTIDNPTTTGSQTTVSCFGGSNGTATVVASGGIPPYQYSWSPSGGSGATGTGLSAGTVYTVTVTDNLTCQTTRNFTLTQPTAVQAVAPSDITICSGASTGLVAIAVGGTPGYTYQWQPGSLNGASQTVSPTATTSYIVTATDANSCTGKDTVLVTVSPNMAQSNISGVSVVGTTTSTSSSVSGGVQSFYNGTCGLITSMQQNVALGTITASTTVLASVPVSLGRPYVARFYEMVPQTNGTGTVTLYFKQSDFNQYNAYASLNGYPLLPQNPTDIAGMDTLRITKVSGGPLGSGTSTLITPTSVTWDAVFQYWRVTFFTPSFSYFYVHANNAGSTPLPVVFSSFTATRKEQTAMLAWATASERNNSGFTVERSNDGKEFNAIGRVETKADDGYSDITLSYSYTDKDPASGINYYRLVQEDRDGNSTFSTIRSLDYSNKSSFNCYPNPTEGQLTIEHNTDKQELLNFRLTDVMGRVVRKSEMYTVKGFNKTLIQLSGLIPGIYNLSISNNTGVIYHSKIAKK